MRFIQRDWRHWKLKFELLRFGVLLLVVALFWIGIELFSTYTTSVEPVAYQKYLEPLNPTLDLDMLENLAARTVPIDEFTPVAAPTTSPLPIPKLSRSGSASSSGETASVSGSLSGVGL
ncbi:hypothetical protein A3B57_01455 [Microgenomates group bacterium RIFCSPLOWO2_01_FULL_47_10]|nr:MAG: hypothetical protein A3B57_01455 [Microgenomates group bacterium RIFCSPLOWO2_01_FULL_47_10]